MFSVSISFFFLFFVLTWKLWKIIFPVTLKVMRLWCKDVDKKDWTPATKRANQKIVLSFLDILYWKSVPKWRHGQVILGTDTKSTSLWMDFLFWILESRNNFEESLLELKHGVHRLRVLLLFSLSMFFFDSLILVASARHTLTFVSLSCSE